MLKTLSLLAINGPSRGNSVLIAKGRSLIGRTGAEGANGEPEKFIDLESFDADEKISRRHARIHFTDTAAEIEDLGSLNGTILNRGEPFTGAIHALQNDDELVLGGTVFRVVLTQE